MFDLLKRNRTLFAIGALILVPLIVYRANAVDSARANPLEKLVLTIISPLERLLSFGVGRVSDGWSRYVDVRGARTQNIGLRQALLRFELQAKQAEAVERENAHLRSMLGLRTRNPALEMITASVVASSHSPFSRVLRIDRGQVHGVWRGAPVVSDAGMVGRIQRVAFASAEVVLITDERLSLEVTLPRSGVRGRLRGMGADGDFHVRIRGVLRTDDIDKGDLVVTSGLAGIYPRGIPVGWVSRVEALAGAQEPVVEVLPHVDLEKLDQVMVVLSKETSEDPVFTPPGLLPPELLASDTATTATTAASLAGTEEAEP